MSYSLRLELDTCCSFVHNKSQQWCPGTVCFYLNLSGNHFAVEQMVTITQALMELRMLFISLVVKVMEKLIIYVIKTERRRSCL